MIITATPYVLDVAAICDLLAAEPEKMSQPTTEAHEPFGSHVLPGEMNFNSMCPKCTPAFALRHLVSLYMAEHT